MSPYIKDFIQISNRIKHDFKQPSCKQHNGFLPADRYIVDGVYFF